MRCFFVASVLAMGCGSDKSSTTGSDTGQQDGASDDGGTGDSDGDGYTDAEEADAGTDPQDASDVIYAGGWPYNSNKDGLGSPSWDTVGALGAQVPRFSAVDQFGDMVDLYDFAGHGVPIVIDMGTIWCAPCKALAAYLSTGDMSHLVWKQNEETGEDEYYPWWDAAYSDLADQVASGEIYWVTVLFSESETSGPATQQDCEDWDAEFPNSMVPVLADETLQLHDWIGVESYPVLNLLDDEMTVQVHSTGGPYEVFAELFPDR
jgi:thiol-disulfide isomerase/thioredoxin